MTDLQTRRAGLSASAELLVYRQLLVCLIRHYCPALGSWSTL